MNLDDAIHLASDAHYGQVDAIGKPYILHPLSVMFSLITYPDQFKIAAILHDIVEDTYVTLQDLESAGLEGDILHAIDLLTHRNHVPYLEYLEPIRANKIARIIKIADIRDNAREERLLQIEDPVRIAYLRNKYSQALGFMLS